MANMILTQNEEQSATLQIISQNANNTANIETEPVEVLSNKTKLMLFGLVSLSVNNSPIFNEIKQAENVEQRHKNIILNQWRFYKFDKGFDNCLCQTPINNIFIVKNRFNGNVANIGCVCIRHIKNDYLSTVSRDIITCIRNRDRGTQPRRRLDHVLCEDANCNEIINVSDMLEHLKNNHPALYKAKLLIEYNKEIKILKDKKSVAGNHKIYFGQHRGETIEQIFNSDNSYFNWILSPRFENSPVKLEFLAFKNIINGIIELEKKILLINRGNI